MEQMEIDQEVEVVDVLPDGTVEGQEVDGEVVTGEVIEPESKGRGRVEVPKVVWDQDLLDRAAKLIDQKFIDAGGDERQDNFGTVYWLDLPHLVAFEEHDQIIPSDKEFWAWFRGYRSENKIWSHDKDQIKRQNFKGHGKSYLGDYNYHKSDSKSYLSSWWSGWGYSGSSEVTRKLAIALGAIQSIVSVINDTNHYYEVQLASGDTREAPNSVTMLGGNQVIVSPQALLDTSISQERAIEVSSGWGLHEGSHIRWSSKVMEALTKPSVLEPMAVAGFLFNILEDLRIEHMTSLDYPGFESYFGTANSYLWDVTEQHAPKKWGPSLPEKINAMTASVKWPTEYGEIVAKSKDQKLRDEYTWFSAWGAAYRDQADQVKPRQALIQALEHLMLDPETKKQLDALPRSGGRVAGLTDQQFKDFLDQLKKQLEGTGKIIASCPTPGHGTQIKLTPEQAAEVNRLVKEKMTQGQVEVMPDEPQSKPSYLRGTSQGDYTVVSTRPDESDMSRRAYLPPAPIVSRMKAAFFFRKTAPEWSERLQRNGSLDEDMLWRVSEMDLRIFERKVIREQPKTSVTMLIDLSSSMSGPKTRISQMLATTMLESLKTMRGVTVRVRGHRHDNEPHVFRIWDPGDPMTRLGLITALVAGGTPDGHAVDWACQELMSTHLPGEDMVLFVISDGQPNVAPNGFSGEQWVKKIVTEFQRKGITTIQIAVDPSAKQTGQQYLHWINYGDENQLVNELGRTLVKLFGGVQ